MPDRNCKKSIKIQEILSSCGILQILSEISFRFDLLNIRILEIDQEIKPFSPHEKEL